MVNLKARLGQVEAERAQLTARLEDTGRAAEADLQRLSSTLCEEVSASQLLQVSADKFIIIIIIIMFIYPPNIDSITSM
jgi:hypothetical protein